MSDEVRFTFAMQWKQADDTTLPTPDRGKGVTRDYAETTWFEDLAGARRSHTDALRGGWVKRGMLEPHVSALRTWKGGRLLPEELAPKADWCGEHGRFACHCQVPQRNGA